MQNPRGNTSLQSADEAQVELQRMQDVLLLLDNLAKREEATVKDVLDCLYDVGSARLINQRINVKALRGPLKSIARFSKPVFRIFALRWFKKNCPRLITNWLYNQVTFDERAPIFHDGDDPHLIDVTPVRYELPPIVEQQAKEINALRGRVSWLTVLLAMAVTAGCLNMLR